MIEQPAQIKRVSIKLLMNIELLIASTLPVAAIIVLGVIGTKQISTGNSTLFIIFALLIAICVCAAEISIIIYMQRMIKQPLTDFISTCQDYLGGNNARRATMTGNDEMTTLATLLNTLLDAVTMEQQQAHEHVHQLVMEVEPVLKGDLRVKAHVASDPLNTISDVCNYLITEFAQLVQWTRYSADQVINSTSDLLERSIELAQMTETQMQRLSHTSEAIERVVAFIQRTSSTLELSVDIMQDIQVYLRQQMKQTSSSTEKNIAPGKGGESRNSTTILEKLEEETQRQVELLESVLHSTQETVSIAESTIGDIYSFAKRTNQSSMSILKTTERVSLLGDLAEQWRNAVEGFKLSNESMELFSSSHNETSGPTPTSSLMRL